MLGCPSSTGACDETGDAEHGHCAHPAPCSSSSHQECTDGPDRPVANGCPCLESKGRAETPPQVPGPLPDKSPEKSWALSRVPYPPSQIAVILANRHLSSKELCRKHTKAGNRWPRSQAGGQSSEALPRPPSRVLSLVKALLRVGRANTLGMTAARRAYNPKCWRYIKPTGRFFYFSNEDLAMRINFGPAAAPRCRAVSCMARAAKSRVVSVADVHGVYSVLRRPTISADLGRIFGCCLQCGPSSSSSRSAADAFRRPLIRAPAGPSGHYGAPLLWRRGAVLPPQ